jgi:hypothetical protein
MIKNRLKFFNFDFMLFVIFPFILFLYSVIAKLLIITHNSWWYSQLNPKNYIYTNFDYIEQIISIFFFLGYTIIGTIIYFKLEKKLDAEDKE